MYFVVFSSKTAFFKLQDILPECFLYREQSPQLEPLICLQEDNACHVGKNCMETLVRRLKVMFDSVVPMAKLAILYYPKRGKQGIGAGVFFRNLQDFRVITVNPSAWSQVKRKGSIYQFSPHKEFFLTGKAAPAEKTDQDKKILT